MVSNGVERFALTANHFWDSMNAGSCSKRMGAGWIFKSRIKDCLEVIQVGDIVLQGVTMPVRCKLTGGVDAIVKYPQNPCGLEVLIDEWIGNSLADAIGLTVPNYGICHLSEAVIEATNGNEEIGFDNAGLSFFSVALNNTIPARNARLLKSVQNKEAERLLLFDYLIDNKDRHEGNILYTVTRPSMVYFIDCSHFMIPEGHFLNNTINLDYELSEERIVSPSILHNSSVYDTLFRTQGYSERKLWFEADCIKQTVSDDLLKEVKSSIPVEWITPQTKKRLGDIFLILRRRVELIDIIAEMIARERRRA